MRRRFIRSVESVVGRDAVLLVSVVAVLALAPSVRAQTACDADQNGDSVVGAADLASVLGAWGACSGCTADINDDGVVNAADLGALLSLWGGSCSALPWATVLEQSPDPAVVTSPAMRKAIAATGCPWRVRDNLTQIEMLLVPPGTYDMGCSGSGAFPCGADESPVHAVTISTAFYLGRYEVRQSQWSAIMGSNPSFFKGVSYPNAANRPVEMVSWNAIQGFLTATSMRLPTEAEWEYAYRAGSTTAFHSTPGAPAGSSDDAFAPSIGWFAGNNGTPGTPAWGSKVVGLKAANALGFHDMAGGVIEWMSDFYSDTYYSSSPSVDPQGPSAGTGRVIRGGSWVDPSDFLRASWRDVNPPTTANFCTGFRVARAP